MNASEKAALRQLQDENFRLRAELNHERKCIDTAVRALREGFPSRVTSCSLDTQGMAAARLVDEAIDFLREPVPK